MRSWLGYLVLRHCAFRRFYSLAAMMRVLAAACGADVFLGLTVRSSMLPRAYACLALAHPLSILFPLAQEARWSASPLLLVCWISSASVWPVVVSLSVSGRWSALARRAQWHVGFGHKSMRQILVAAIEVVPMLTKSVADVHVANGNGRPVGTACAKGGELNEPLRISMPRALKLCLNASSGHPAFLRHSANCACD